MDTLKKTDLEQLIEANGQWHISLYMPTHPVGQEHLQDPIRLKNLLSQVEKDLLAYDVRRPDVEQILRPAEELLTNKEFWQTEGSGLAVFLSRDLSRIYRLSAGFDELAIVGKSFYVQPILPLLNGNQNFYLLTLSQNLTRLFIASRDNLSEVELIDTPRSMSEALQMDDLQKNLGFQTSTESSGTGSERAAIHYGQGEETNKKELMRRYFQQVDEGIARVVENSTIPMVIAGVDYLLPIFRETTSYKNIVEAGIGGNADRQDLTELHAQAWKLVEPTFLDNQQKAIDRFLEFHGQQNGLATSSLDDAVKAAIGGRVETLIVPLGVQKWGRYDPATDSVHFDEEPTPENEDMINYAAAQTILNSGSVYAVPADQLPGGEDVAAILRYAI